MVIYEGSSEKNEVAIIFDDGPNPEITPKILKVLKDKNVKATFFLIGRNAEKHHEVVKQIVNEGHDIGNHTYTHPDDGMIGIYAQQGQQGILEEIQDGANALIKSSGLAEDEIRFLRPPSLQWDEQVGTVAVQLYGNRIIMSSCGSQDWSWDDTKQWDENDTDRIKAKANEIFEDVSHALKPGAIIGLHDSAQYGVREPVEYPNWMKRALPTLAALPKIIDEIERRGFSIVKLSSLELREENLRPRS